jgi:hypothetical protein
MGTRRKRLLKASRQLSCLMLSEMDVRNELTNIFSIKKAGITMDNKRLFVTAEFISSGRINLIFTDRVFMN